MSDTLLDAARRALDTLTHIIGMRHLSYIGQAMAESAERTLRTAIAEAETVEPVAKIGRAANITNRLRELADAVTRGPDAVASEFTMSVPARPERDADLVLSAAADEIERLRNELRKSHEHQHEAEALAGHYLVQRDDARDTLAAERERLRAELAEAVTALPQAIRNERERCASACEDEARLWEAAGNGPAAEARLCAARIRSLA